MEKRTTKTNLIGKEVKMMKKLIFIALLLAMLGIGSTAQAFWTGTVYDGLGGSASNVLTFDWSSSGSGVAIDLGPFGTPFPVGTVFTFLYQAELVGLTDPNGNPIAFPGLTTAFEYTAVAAIQEQVISFTNPAPGIFSAIFTTLGGQWAILNDIPADSDVPTGAGFDNGSVAAFGTINPNQLTFFSATAGGIGIGSTILEGLVTSADPAFLDPSAIIFDFRFEGTLNYPPLDSTTTGFFIGPGIAGDYTVDGNDLLLKVDGSSKFSVPEPSTILLLGIGLLGLGGLSRKRIRK
jgi:hypothetical protein